MTITTELSQQEKIDFILAHRDKTVARPLNSDRVPEVGSAVLIGNQYRRETLRKAVITKIDKRGVIATDIGVNFSSKWAEITSTRKIALDGDNLAYGSAIASTTEDLGAWWQMLDVDETYRRLLVRLESDRKADLDCKKRKLQGLVDGLDSDLDSALIEESLKMLES